MGSARWISTLHSLPCSVSTSAIAGLGSYFEPRSELRSQLRTSWIAAFTRSLKRWGGRLAASTAFAASATLTLRSNGCRITWCGSGWVTRTAVSRTSTSSSSATIFHGVRNTVNGRGSASTFPANRYITHVTQQPKPGWSQQVPDSVRETMVRPERFELPTFWFVAVAARRVNDLHGLHCGGT